jgi:TolB-like protein/Tfp pilus assembly protein PilF
MKISRRWHRLLVKLRRRRIIETLAAFIAGGWLILEFVHWALIMHYHLPEKLFDVSFVCIISALLSTLLWRWFHSHESKARKVKMELILIPVIISAAAVLNFYLILQMKIPEEDLAWKIAWKNSIAVLPFSDLSPEQNQDTFCEGISDDIITKLGSVEGLKVISRTSSELYKNSKKSIAQIGQELRVKQILEGTLKIEKDHVRINVKLIETKRGFNIWAKGYDKKIESCFEIQNEIASDIASRLKLNLAEGKIRILKKREPSNLEAYKAYQWARLFENNYRDGEKKEDFEKSVEMYQKAIDLDPNYVMAYWGLGNIHEARYVRENNALDLDQMEKYFSRAFDIDPQLPESSVGLGWLNFHRGLLDLSYESFKKALDLEPGSIEVNAGAAAFLRSVGLYEKAIKYYLRAIDFDPFTISHYSSAANCYLYMGEYEKGIRLVRQALGIEPNNWRLRLNYARQLLMLGKYGEAEVEINRAEKINPASDLVRRHRIWLLAARGDKERAESLIQDSDREYSYEMTIIYALLGKEDKAIQNINEGINVGFQTVKDYLYSYLFLASNPFYKSLHDHPEFRQLLEKERNNYDEKSKKYGGL